MKYKLSVILSAIILGVLIIMYIGHEPIETSQTENRNMATFSMIFNPITDKQSLLYNADQSISERLENAMKDQNPMRDKIMEHYLKIELQMAGIYDRTIDFFSRKKNETPSNTDQNSELDFIKYPGYGYARLSKIPKLNYKLVKSGGAFYRLNDTDWLIETPWTTLGNEQKMKTSINTIIKIQNNYPNMKVYGYFVSHGNNLPWYESYMGKSFGDRYEQLAQLTPESIKLDRLYYNDFNDYCNLHYQSDHHWDTLGVERGYNQIYDMFSKDFVLSKKKTPIKTWNFSDLYNFRYKGSRANALQAAYSGSDNFTANEYDLGNRKTYAISPNNLSNEISVRLGLWDEYKVGDINKEEYTDHYIKFYGSAKDATGKIYTDDSYIYIIKNKEQNTGRNLLLFGDSNMRALKDVLATHFDTTIYLDYRIMAIPYIDELINKYEINTMLSVVQDGIYWFDGNEEPYCFRFSENIK